MNHALFLAGRSTKEFPRSEESICNLFVQRQCETCKIESLRCRTCTPDLQEHMIAVCCRYLNHFCHEKAGFSPSNLEKTLFLWFLLSFSGSKYLQERMKPGSCRFYVHVG